MVLSPNFTSCFLSSSTPRKQAVTQFPQPTQRILSSSEEIAKLANLAEEHDYSPRQILYQQSEYSSWVNVVAQGKIKIYHSSNSGTEFILGILRSGEVFGEVSPLIYAPLPCSAQALEKSVVLRLKRENFLSPIVRNTKATINLIEFLSKRLLESQTRLSEMALERSEVRIIHTLCRLHRLWGANLPLTRLEIAGMSGTTTETAIRVTSHLKKRHH